MSISYELFFISLWLNGFIYFILFIYFYLIFLSFFFFFDETDKTKHQFLSQTVKKKKILKMGEGLVPKLHKLNIKEANWMKHT